MSDPATGVSPDTAPLRILIVCDGAFLGSALAASLGRDRSCASARCISAAQIPARIADEADVLLVYAERAEDLVIAQHLRDCAPRDPIVGCGLAESGANAIAWTAAGAAGYIPKTTHLAEFLPRLRQILDRSARVAAAVPEATARSSAALAFDGLVGSGN